MPAATTTTAYKLFTHDLRSPIQGGEPVFDGKLPCVLPIVHVDRSQRDCAPGWNACAQPEDALRIGGLWPNGHPSRLFVVETDTTVVARGDKLRAATWTIVRECSEEEIREGVTKFSERYFKPHALPMAAEQMEWRAALARPKRDEALVDAGLREALKARGLEDWTLKKFSSERDAWDARGAGDAWAARGVWDARDARGAWDAWAARAAWAAWDAWDARGARDARDARGAWDARGARGAWDARDARGAWDAWGALTVFFAATMKWTKQRPDLLTIGLRDAYSNGLGIAIPTGPKELGWAMVDVEVAP